jgi:hypothetical protein
VVGQALLARIPEISASRYPPERPPERPHCQSFADLGYCRFSADEMVRNMDDVVKKLKWTILVFWCTMDRGIVWTLNAIIPVIL